MPSDSPVQELKDLKGRRIGFQEPDSPSGFLLPVGMLQDLDWFKRVNDSHGHHAGDQPLLHFAELRDSLATGALVLYLQPQTDFVTQTLSGVELLLRWDHPERGLLAPSQFLPHAAEAGPMPMIGDQVARLMFQLASRLPQHGLPPPVIAMNLSGEELADPGLMDALAQRISSAQPTDIRFELEVSKRSTMSKDSVVDRHQGRLRDAGSQLAIDELGMGYSNPERLKDIRFDRLRSTAACCRGSAKTPAPRRAANMRMATCCLDRCPTRRSATGCAGVRSSLPPCPLEPFASFRFSAPPVCP